MNVFRLENPMNRGFALWLRRATITSPFFIASRAFAQTNAPAALPTVLPSVGPSLLRVSGAFVLVIALFLGGVWLFKNWQRLALQRGGRAPRLNVLEVRSLGGRQALYVVAYEQERFLLSASPNGVNLLSHLPAGEAALPDAAKNPPPSSFAQALSQVLKGK